jgi:hypothetical protein
VHGGDALFAEGLDGVRTGTFNVSDDFMFHVLEGLRTHYLNIQGMASVEPFGLGIGLVFRRGSDLFSLCWVPEMGSFGKFGSCRLRPGW